MDRLRACFLILGVLVLCAPAFPQGAPYVFVSGGPTAAQLAKSPCMAPNPSGSTGELPSGEVCQPSVYTAKTPFPTTATIFATDQSGGQPEGMVLGPDNYLYVCEPQNKTIIRFSAGGPSGAVTVFAYTGTGPQNPQCGHFTSDGALVVSDQKAGSGVWEFQNMAGSATPTSIVPTNVLGSAQLGAGFVGAGLTQLKNGDLAFVDNASGTLYVSAYSPAYPHFMSVRTIATGLTGAIGVARNSGSDIFVSYATGQIKRLTSTYIAGTSDFANNTEFTNSSSASCFSSVADQPMDMAFSADDTLYVATQDLTGKPYNNAGKVYSITLTSPGCNAATAVTTLPRWDSDSIGGDDTGGLNSDDEYIQGYGIALPPTSVTNFPVSATPAGNPTTLLYNFGFSAFEAILSSPLTETCGSATTVTETQVFPADMSMFGSFPAGVLDAEPLYGEGGFNNVFTINDAEDCPLPGNDYFLESGFLNFTNPYLIECNGTCVVDPSIGAFPLAGLIPSDPGGGGKGIPPPSASFYFTNLPPGTSTSGTTSNVTGDVCGLFFLRNLLVPDPSATVDPDDLLTISFRLTNKPATGPLCTGSGVQGISNVPVIATMAQFSNTAPFFDLIILPNHANPGSPPPFLSLGAGWYAYVLNVKGLATGTYNFSAIFPNGTAAIQSAAITVVPESAGGQQ
jgi:hypothetical protein